MATLILTSVGTLVGGPIGGALGALLGQAVDARVLAPKGRQGPRLGDLTVQTSSYGTAIPKLFGRLRVAGTVIWATDLREDRHRQSAGKGRGATTTYSYSASFAVALSGRPILGVGRIWAEGKLLRGSAGDWKSAIGGFRLHIGGEAGAADPLIAAAEGETPAYRGIAHAVFEDLQLADFGNRIPSLTFEVIADPAAIGVGDVAGALSGGAVTGATAPVLEGYAASGDSVRGAIEALTTAFPVHVRDDGVRLVIDDAPAVPVALDATELGASADGRRTPRVTAVRGGEGGVPDEVNLAYYEQVRDWQAGLQRARRGSMVRHVERIELPAALTAGAAKAAAEARLARLLAERRTATVRLPFARMDVRPGMAVTVPGLGGRWRVRDVAVEKMAVIVGLVAETGPGVAATAVAGRATIAADAAIGASVIRLLDLPPLDDTPASVPMLWVAAAGTGAGWRRAALSLSRDDGASWQPIGDTAAPAIMGRAMSVLGAGEPALFDERAGVEIEVLNDDMWLESRDDDALVAGANAAMLGREMIQFAHATPIGPRRFRLERLLRGRRGTEDAMAEHDAGEPFVLIERAVLLPVPLDPAAIGTTVCVQAIGIIDAPGGVEVAATVAARALRPPAPVHLRMTREGDALRSRWTRRSRSGWAWTDGADTPLGEEREAYRVTLTPDVGMPRTVDLDAPEWSYTAAMRGADGSEGATGCWLEVRQAGTTATGIPARARFAF